MNISIAPLINSLETTTNSYKFYWLNGILSCLEKPNVGSLIPVDDIVHEMLLEAWNSVCQFKLYYGFYDRLPLLIKQIQIELCIPDVIKRGKLRTMLEKNSEASSVITAKIELLRYVPYRFLSSWCDGTLSALHDHKRHKRIAELAQRDENFLYCFIDDCIEIRQHWIDFINSYKPLIRSAIFNRLNFYLSKRNPNVPAIAMKIQGIEKRNLAQAKGIWKKFLKQSPITCIYSTQLIYHSDFSLDHFVPWSYVAHDEIWNIAPTTKSINSQKNDRLPASPYLEKFIKLQFQLFHFINKSEENWEKYLIEYTNIFKMDLLSISALDFEQFATYFRNLINPMLQIAKNMGFNDGWKLEYSSVAVD